MDTVAVSPTLKLAPRFCCCQWDGDVCRRSGLSRPLAKGVDRDGLSAAAASDCSQCVTASGRGHSQPCSTINQPRLAEGRLECLVAIIIIIYVYLVFTNIHTIVCLPGVERSATWSRTVILETGDILNNHLAHQQAAVTNKELGLVMCKFFRRFGVAEHLIDLWNTANTDTTLNAWEAGLRVNVPDQCKSGESATYLRNTVWAMVTAATCFDMGTCVASLFSGDDSVLWGNLRMRDATCVFTKDN